MAKNYMRLLRMKKETEDLKIASWEAMSRTAGSGGRRRAKSVASPEFEPVPLPAPRDQSRARDHHNKPRGWGKGRSRAACRRRSKRNARPSLAMRAFITFDTLTAQYKYLHPEAR